MLVTDRVQNFTEQNDDFLGAPFPLFEDPIFDFLGSLISGSGHFLPSTVGGGGDFCPQRLEGGSFSRFLGSRLVPEGDFCPQGLEGGVIFALKDWRGG